MKHLLLSALILSSLCLGCGNDEAPKPPDLKTIPGVIEAIQEAYRSRDAAAYEDLLADDFRFYFDSDERLQYGLDEFWTKERDVASTMNMFSSSLVRQISINLSFDSPLPVNELGREDWYRNPVSSPHVWVRMAPLPGEDDENVLQISSHDENFYFRKGRNPDDSSETADRYYLVEWHDRAESSGGAAQGLDPKDAVAVHRTSWGQLKLMFAPEKAD